MNWGKGILISFILFATFLAAMITIMMRQDVDLVSAQYYKDDLAYQQQYERKLNTENLKIKPEISFVQNQYIRIDFSSAGSADAGELTLFRPSQDKLDQRFSWQASSDSVQLFQVNSLERGAYRAKMSWKMAGKEYYMEELLFIE